MALRCMVEIEGDMNETHYEKVKLCYGTSRASNLREGNIKILALHFALGIKHFESSHSLLVLSKS
jgi:hypothetical protein